MKKVLVEFTFTDDEAGGIHDELLMDDVLRTANLEGVEFKIMGRCETCRHWEANGGPNEWGDCGQKFINAKLWCFDGTGFETCDSGIETHKDFHCAEWEAKK